MDTKHPNGYWISQLTDEKIKELIIRLLSKHEKFNTIDKIQRNGTAIVVKYYYEKTNTYLRHKESTLSITDFELNGKVHSDFKFYDFMIELLGEEYEEELVEHLDQIIQTMPEDSSRTKGYINYRAQIKDDLKPINTLI